MKVSGQQEGDLSQLSQLVNDRIADTNALYYFESPQLAWLYLTCMPLRPVWVVSHITIA